MSAMQRRRVDVLGVHISALTMTSAVARVAEWIASGRQHYVCVTGVHGVMESQADGTLRDIHNRAGMVTPDGMPMVWAAHHAGAFEVERVCGRDLLPAVARAGADNGWRFFLYGGKEGVPERLAAHLERWYPGLEVVGYLSPPFRPLTTDEDAAIVQRINALGPHVVWVGLSTPKQERWMAEHVGRLDAPVMIGIGAAFDMHTGAVPNAPELMQRAGLEWLFRLVQEPRRLWRRYLANNPRFVMRILAHPPRLVDERVDTGPAVDAPLHRDVA